MAQGVPVVSTAELGTRDVLQEGKGVWIAKEELTDFSEKIIQMLGNSDLRVKLGEAGQEYAHSWSASKQAERMTDFYQTILVAAKLPRRSADLTTTATHSNNSN
jgi:glycosyltransferase involved in cell wall biosynthesis